jgi:filamentous hemagglutinin family protein
MNRHGSLNHIYRLIYSRALHVWVAVSEITKGQGKGGRSRQRLVNAGKKSGEGYEGFSGLRDARPSRPPVWILLGLPLICSLAQAAPTGGLVVSGVGHIIQSSVAGGAVNTTITQGSSMLNLNWSGFNVAPDETVTFKQPSASAVAVNRIFDTNGAQIYGHLNANGQVYLIDPNGILFGKGAQVNVGGLVASTLDLTGSSGNSLTFGPGNDARAAGVSGIDNQGAITAGRGGFITLLGHTVRNEGRVTAQLGTVALAGGSAFTLSFSENQLVSMVVSHSQWNDLVRNGGVIQVNGGQVILTAGARDALLASAVNNSGIIEAQTVRGQAGHIQLLAGMAAGTTTNNGTLDASAPNGGNGGFIETSGHSVDIGNNATITTQATNGLNGSWLIDPADFTIASTATGTVTGGTPSGDISGATLSTALGAGNVTIQSSQGSTTSGSGNINVNDAVSWNANTLTLTAANNINVNAVMTATGTAALALNPATANGGATAVTGGTLNMGLTSSGFTGRIDLAPTTSISINGTPYTIINTLGTQLDANNNIFTDNLYFTTGSNNSTTGNIDKVTATYSSAAGLTLGPVTPIAATGAYNPALGITVNPNNGQLLVGGGSPSENQFPDPVYQVNPTTGTITTTTGPSYVTNSNLAVDPSKNVVWATGGPFGSTGPLASFPIKPFGGTGTNLPLTGSDTAISGIAFDPHNQTTYYTTGGYYGNSVGDFGTINPSTGKTTALLTNTTGLNTLAYDPFTGDLITVGGNFINQINPSTGQIVSTKNISNVLGNNGGYALENIALTGTGQLFASSGGSNGGQLFFLDYAKSELVGSNSNFMASPFLASYLSGVTLVALPATMTLQGITANATTLKGDYVLGSNIDATPTNTWGAAGCTATTCTGFTPIGGTTSVSNFSGVFDGLGHTITNLTINRSVTNVNFKNNIGLFGADATTAVLRNVALLDSDMNGGYSVGELVGSNSGTVNNSYATGVVNGTGDVGGLVGNNSGTVNNSYATGSVTGGMGTLSVGGLVGANYGTISNSYATSSVTVGTGSFYVGGLVGNNNGTLSNAFYNVDAVLINSTHQLTAGGLYNTQYTDWFTHGEILNIADYSATLPVGTGGYYDVSTVQGLKDMLGFSESNAALNFRLTSSIDLTGSAGFYVPYFAGKFDGGNNTISNLTINENNGDIGMFGYLPVSTSSVSNLGVVNDSISGVSYVGGLVGYDNGGLIDNSYAKGAVGAVPGGSYEGGLVGLLNSGTINNSYATSRVSGNGIVSETLYVGGLVGSNKGGTISNSYATGSVSGSGYVGGLAGQSDGTISNSYATGAVTGAAGSETGTVYAGGLVGLIGSGTISNSYAKGGVTLNGIGGSSYTGGLAGESRGTISNSYATGNVSGNAAITYCGCVGGLVGESIGAISNSYATGSASGSGHVGGLVGVSDSTIDNSYATGAVSGTGHLGGLVGDETVSGLGIGGTISNSYATGSVSGSGYVGGLVGVSNDTINNSYATGAVSGSGNYLGGLVGSNTGTINYSYATGSVTVGTGSFGDGGLVGSNTGIINYSYATGVIPNSAGVYSFSNGGVAGSNSGTISNSFWDITTQGITGMGSSSTGTWTNVQGLTTTQLQTPSSLTGFNFTSHPGATGNNWVIVNADGSLATTAQVTQGATLPMLASEYSTTLGNSHQLQLMTMDLTGAYTLGQSFNASATNSQDIWLGSSFVPIGNSITPFTGSLSGAGFTIDNLTINRPASDYVGLIGYLGSGGSITGVNLTNAQVTGQKETGGLAGRSDGTISGDSVAVTVSGTGYVGGLVGYNSTTGTISTSDAMGSVTGSGAVYVGGLVGGGSSGSDGGLVGYNQGSISNSYATGIVSGTNNLVGGLVGYNNNGGMISNSYATGTVSGGGGVGGLVGYNSTTGTISNSYATGSVSRGSYDVGGLVGANYGTISNSYTTSYATGIVPGTNDLVGGLVGYNNTGGTISNGFWDDSVNTAGLGARSTPTTGAKGLTTTQMQTASNFVGFDFTVTPVWGVHSGVNNNNPILCVFGGCSPLMVYIDPVTGSSIYGTTPLFTYTLVNASGSLFHLTNATTTGTAAYTASAPTSTSNAGSYSFSYLDGLGLTGSGSANYSLVPWTTPTSWTVAPAPLLYTAAPEAIPGGLTRFPLSGIVTGFVPGDDLSNSTTGTLSWTTNATSSSPAGHYAIDGNGLSAVNYVFSQAPGNATALTIQSSTGTATAQSAQLVAADATLLSTLNTMLSNANNPGQTGGNSANAGAGNNYIAVNFVNSSGGWSAPNLTLTVTKGGVTLPPGY